MEKQVVKEESKTSQVSYSTYLKINELIGLQFPLSSPVAHDELLFIVIHQVYELWFKLINFEISSLILSVKSKDFIASMRLTKRLSEIMRVLIDQLDVLETMSPVEFNRFRSSINPASGFQSLQFREFEMLLGVPMELLAPLRNMSAPPLQIESLRAAFLNALVDEGFIKNTKDSEEIILALKTIYESPIHTHWHVLCEELIHLDERVTLWRFRHVQMVERMIGMKRGTGGSLGAGYLMQTISARVFPELWELRTRLT